MILHRSPAISWESVAAIGGTSLQSFPQGFQFPNYANYYVAGYSMRLRQDLR